MPEAAQNARQPQEQAQTKRPLSGCTGVRPVQQSLKAVCARKQGLMKPGATARCEPHQGKPSLFPLMSCANTPSMTFDQCRTQVMKPTLLPPAACSRQR